MIFPYFPSACPDRQTLPTFRQRRQQVPNFCLATSIGQEQQKLMLLADGTTHISSYSCVEPIPYIAKCSLCRVLCHLCVAYLYTLKTKAEAECTERSKPCDLGQACSHVLWMIAGRKIPNPYSRAHRHLSLILD
jgi:hypothetical protein